MATNKKASKPDPQLLRMLAIIIVNGVERARRVIDCNAPKPYSAELYEETEESSSSDWEMALWEMAEDNLVGGIVDEITEMIGEILNGGDISAKVIHNLEEYIAYAGHRYEDSFRPINE